jgi:hypothetical protein
MRLARQLHLFSGVFFAPTILFFAFTGFLQTYSLHEEHDGVKPQPWIAALADVHKHQRMPAPPRPAAPTSVATTPATATNAAAPITASAQPAQVAVPSAPRPRRKQSFPLQVFMGFMSVGLIGSSLVGIWMGFQLKHSPALIWGLLLAGTIIPVAAFFIGVRP